MSAQNLFSKRIRIVVFYDNQKLTEKTFLQGPIVFGRIPTCDLHLDYPFISRSHCQVFEENGKIYLKDLGSRNGLNIQGIIKDQFEIDKKLELKLDKLLVEIHVEAPVSNKSPARTSQPSTAIGVSFSKTETLSDLQNAETVIQKRPLPTEKPVSTAKPVPSAIPVSSAKPVETIKKKSSDRTPLVDRSFTSDMVEYHPGVRSATRKKLEAVVYWQDQVFEVREFEPQEKVTIGSSPFASLNVPIIPKGWALAKVDFDKAQCYVPNGKEFSVVREGKSFSSQDLIHLKQVNRKGQGFAFKMSQHDVVNVDLGGGMKVFLRYVPATKSLTRKKVIEPDFAIKQAILGSAILHGIVSLLLIIMAPATKNVPKLKNVPERYARLLVEPPKPIIPVPPPAPPPPPPEPPKQEVVKQEPPKPKPKPKPQVKVEKVKPKKMALPKKLEKPNKFPMVVKNPVPVTTPQVQRAPVPVEAPPVKVEALGALAALGAVSNSPIRAPAMSNIKIDKNAGGLASKTPNTQGMISALPSSNGKLMVVGNGSVKTGGQGIGSGTAYGTQGLSGGGAGGRGIAGALVGTPQLATSASGSGKSEGLTRAQVMAVVQKHLSEVQRCYEKSLLSNPGLAGRMEFEWDIEPRGTVSAVRIKRSTVNGGDSLGSCVKGVFAAMKFPVAKNGQSTTPNIGFPFGRL